MNLLLLSHGLGAMDQFLPSPAKIGFVPTAGEPYADPYFVVDDRLRLQSLGYDIIDLDISKFDHDVFLTYLAKVDGLFVAGGNSFYLMQQIRNQGLYEVLRTYINIGRPYIGASAGAIICGPSLKPTESLDDPSAAPDLKTQDGLDVVEFVTLPHFGKPKCLEKYNGIIAKYKDIMPIIPLKDDQAIIVKSRVDFEVIASEIVFS